MRYFLTALLGALLLLIPTLVQAQVPQDLEDINNETWRTDNPFTTYLTTSGDSAIVYQPEAYWWAQVDNAWWVSCPGLSAYPLARLITGQQGDFTDRISCLEEIRSLHDSLTSSTFPLQQVRNYASQCETNITNDTIHAPDPSGTNASIGDTVAAITPEGECAGFGIVEEQGLTFAAAGEDKWSSGLLPGESIRLEVYDIDKSTTKWPQVSWRSAADLSICENPGFCGEGAYLGDVFHQVE